VTIEDSKSGERDCGADAAAYVLGALEPEEAEAFRRHMARVRAGRFLSRPVIAAAAGLAVVAALIIGLELGSSGSNSTRVIAATVSGSPGSAQLRVTGTRAELIVRRFPQPAPGHIYEVWELRHGAGVPSPTKTLFSVNSSGAGDVGVPGNLKGVSKVLVTQEPAGGSQVPTRAPVIVASLA
jgi:hypothetical protein